MPSTRSTFRAASIRTRRMARSLSSPPTGPRVRFSFPDALPSNLYLLAAAGFRPGGADSAAGSGMESEVQECRQALGFAHESERKDMKTLRAVALMTLAAG